MDESGLPAWALGTWHAAFLLVAFIAVAHATGSAGGLTADIGTLPGILAFAWLWAISWWTARGVLRASSWGRDQVVAHVGMHGAAAGAVFVLGLGIAVVLHAALQEGDPEALIGLPFVLTAAGVASVPGAVVAWILLGIDVLLARGIDLRRG